VKGIAYELKEWHVLQVRRGDLKVEFDSMEYWMTDLLEDWDMLMIDGYAFKVVGLSSLRELYRRGLEATTSQNDEVNRTKHSAIAEKYEALCGHRIQMRPPNPSPVCPESCRLLTDGSPVVVTTRRPPSRQPACPGSQARVLSDDRLCCLSWRSGQGSSVL